MRQAPVSMVLSIAQLTGNGAIRYYEEKGFAVILVSRILNLLALAFTIVFSAFLLLIVKWRALHSECILRDTCDISEASGPYCGLCALAALLCISFQSFLHLYRHLPSAWD